MRKLLVVLATMALGLTWAGNAFAANGDNLRTFVADRDVGACASFNAAGNHSSVGTGIGFDGAQLYLSCWGDQHIVGVSPADGSKLSDHIVIGQSGYGAMAWDNGRQVLWACSAQDFFTVGQINLVTNVWVPVFASQGCIDGLAYDASDDTIWSSADVSSQVQHYTTAGLLLSSNSISGLIGNCGNSGIAVGGQKLYLANNGCSEIYEVAKDFSSSTLFATFPARLEDLECDNISFVVPGGKAAIWSQDAFDNVLNAWEIPAGACLFGGGGPGPPANLTLEPETDTNTVGEEHCVTATVTDADDQPTPDITVQFSVSGANTASGSAVTDASGMATFCYTGTVAGADAITAYADTDGDGTQDADEPFDTATKVYTAGPPARLVLTPAADTNTVDDQHCVTATVTDQFGNPTPGITVRFRVTGSVTTSGSAVTDANGQAQFCYTGPALPGTDKITAFADTDNDGVNDADEPRDVAKKVWVLPASTAGCKVTYGGRITAANRDKATFGGNAKADGLTGQEEYQDHGPAVNMNVHSINVLAVVCNRRGTQASIFGKATVDGAGSFDYRIDLKDLGEPGSTDTYRIRLSNAYDSGEQTLNQGNVQIH